MQLRSLNHPTAPTGNEQPPQLSPQVVKISSRTIFDLMLDELNLPRAQYKLRTAGHHRVQCTVAFCASTHQPGEVLQRIEMQGTLSADPEIAEEYAALEGIRHMENWENMVIEDLNYSELRYVQAENRELRAKLKEAEKYQLQLGKGLLKTLDATLSAARKISEHIDDSFSLGHEETDERMNATLMLFDKVAFDLHFAKVRGYKCI